MDINAISAIIFYLVIFLLIYINKKRFDVQGKVLFLYRTKIGLKLMDRIAKACPRLLKFLSTIGIYTAYVGLIFITAYLFKGLYNLFMIPNSLPTVAPVIPGLPIPGLGIKVPFWYGIISLFLVIVIHEFSHGVIARLHNIKLKSSGVGMLAILPLAFVEPDEEQLKTKSKKQQLSVFAAGPFANILTAVIIFFILPFLLSSQASMVDFDGVSFQEIIENEPAYIAGVPPNIVFNTANNQTIITETDLRNILSTTKPGDPIILSNKNISYQIITSSNPDNDSIAYLGVMGLETSYSVKPEKTIIFSILNILSSLLSWLFILGLGIGLANLLPLGPVDGGRIMLTTLVRFFPEDKAKSIWAKISIFVLLLLVLNLIVPWLRPLFM